MPFTIVLKHAVDGETSGATVKPNPGSRTTGIAVTMKRRCTNEVVWAAELKHKGREVRAKLDKRRAVRRARRSRKTRYRKPRFLNRRRKDGWLPPSLEIRIGNVIPQGTFSPSSLGGWIHLVSWVRRLCRRANVTGLSMELVKFDTQAMQDPEIAGIELGPSPETTFCEIGL